MSYLCSVFCLSKPAVDHYEELEGHALKEALAIDTVTLPALKAAGLQPFALIVTRRRSAYGTVYPDVKLDLDEVWFADVSSCIFALVQCTS